MECGRVEERLSEYVERVLPHDAMARIAEHLQECPRCQGLMEEIRAILVTCRAFPSFEVDPALLDRILLRTSGRPRTRPLRERFRSYFLQPVLTPRFAVGVGLALLTVALTIDMIGPHAGALTAALSPREIFRQVDRGVQGLYSSGLKLYNAKNEWQSQITFFGSQTLHSLQDMIKQLDLPVEGNKKPDEQKPPEKAPNKKSSVLLFPA
jgi:hypothetical protein